MHSRCNADNGEKEETNGSDGEKRRRSLGVISRGKNVRAIGTLNIHLVFPRCNILGYISGSRLCVTVARDVKEEGARSSSGCFSPRLNLQWRRKGQKSARPTVKFTRPNSLALSLSRSLSSRRSHRAKRLTIVARRLPTRRFDDIYDDRFFGQSTLWSKEWVCVMCHQPTRTRLPYK